MLYTKKEIEKRYSNLVAEFISRGARIDFNNGNYISSQLDHHIDLIADDGRRIIIYITTNAASGNAPFRKYDKGLCEIVVGVSKKKAFDDFYYDRDDTIKYTVYKFLRYKDVYTDDEKQYKIMVAKETERAHLQYENEKNERKVKYNMSVILNIVRKRKGFKRTKPEHIMNVEKSGGDYRIFVNNGKKRDIIHVNRWSNIWS